MRRYICIVCFFLYFLSSITFSEEVENSIIASCGPYSLMVVAKTFGIDVDIISISHLAGTTPKGTSMKGLADAAYKLGMKARGMKIPLRQLVRLRPPIIAYLNSDHYLVIEKILQDRLYINEINKPRYFISISDFDKIWDGYVLVVSPIRNKNSKKQPNIQVDKPAYDFGVADSDKIIKHTFIIKNAGNSELLISDVAPDCTCSNVKISSKTIPPNEQARLYIEFDIGGRWGEVKAVTRVFSNDFDQPIVTVVIKGIATTTIPIFPRKVELGRIFDKKKTIFKKIQIRDPGAGKLQIKDVESSSDAIQAKIFQNKIGEDAEIHLSINPEEFEDKFEGHITIYTNDKKTTQIKIPFSGEIAGPIQVFPERFFFGFIEKGKSSSQSIVVTSHKKANWKITKVESSLQEISIELVPIIVGKKYIVNAKLLVDKTSSNIIKGNVKLHTNHPKQPLVEVPIYAIVE